ncbi:MAG: hypothetical protein Q9213_005109 [Squamulea squamosa]
MQISILTAAFLATLASALPNFHHGPIVTGVNTTTHAFPTTSGNVSSTAHTATGTLAARALRQDFERLGFIHHIPVHSRPTKIVTIEERQPAETKMVKVKVPVTVTVPEHHRGFLKAGPHTVTRIVEVKTTVTP